MTDEFPVGTVTVLFTDVEGSTDLRTREGDDVAQEILRTHERLLREQLEKHGGREIVFLGDGFMVAFASARKAITCAIGIQRCIDEHNRENPNRQIRVRTGLNTGEVLQESGTLYGAAVNAAARIAAKANGGQILVSQIVKELSGAVPDFTFVNRGLFSLKGFATRWRLHEVMWKEDSGGSLSAAGTLQKPSVPATGVTLSHAQLEETYPRPDLAPVVGREAERAAIEQELDAVLAGSLRVVSVEGEAGIGKTRLIEEAVDAAAKRGFGVVMVGADEELRGPFFLLRTLFASTSMEALSDEAMAREALEQSRDILWGRGGRGVGLSPAEQMLHVYDVATVAIRSVAEGRPLAVLFDDVHWADDDSLKLIRYLVRTSAFSHIFLMTAFRPESVPVTNAATTLAVDLERMHLARRLPLERFTRMETAQLLGHVLGGPVSTDCAATLHSRGEGVPFFIVEFAQSFRQARLLQPVDGTWQISMAARSTVPPSVQILIERRLAQLPPETRAALADGAVLGRRFRTTDLDKVRANIDNSSLTGDALSMVLAPAASLSLLSELPEGATYDFSFTHDEIRAALVAGQSRQRLRAIHSAIVEMLSAETDARAALPALAYHALKAGDHVRGIRFSIEAARAALEAYAPEEAVRVVDAARAVASLPQERAQLLLLRDDALAALGRGDERLAVLAEMDALASALGDPGIALEARLRRASAARLTGDHEEATEAARRARRAAEKTHDREAELRACMELGQALLRTSLGESFMPPPTEVNLDEAGEAFEQAAAFAREVGDEWSLAAARRELGVIENGRARRRFLSLLEQFPDLLDDPSADPREEPVIREHFDRAKRLIGEAVEGFEAIGDRRALMSSLIALAYANIIEDTQHGHAGRIEQIRRLRRGLRRLTSESERAESEAHMLYSIHVYARAHAHPDLALHRGAEAYEAARLLGDRWLEFLAAGGVALTHISMAEVRDAEAWLDRAGAAVLATTGPLPARQIETWRGLLRSAAGDSRGMSDHLQRALAVATDRGSPAARCEILALLAIESVRHAVANEDDELLAAAQRWADDTLRLAKALPGDLSWEAQAHAALGQIALARGETQDAERAALLALSTLERTRHFYKLILPDILLLVARALAESDDPKAHAFRAETCRDLQAVAEGTHDDNVRARWFRAPIQRELAELVGANDLIVQAAGRAELPGRLTEREAEVLREVTSGKTNREMAADSGVSEEHVARRLDEVFAKLGVSTPAEATALALREGIA
jgi:class 3 adenylate cyclase/DNA-binding CsgD family transcriptional regulator